MLEEMTAKNSTADESPPHNTSATYDYTSPTAAFFDPAWQLANAVEFYFQYAIIGIGIFGTAANALVLYGLVAYHARETKKRAINLLMINQNLLDLLSCVLLAITYSIKVSNIHLTGALGYYLCTIFINENAHSCTLHASIINLMAITVERYLKVVHPFWSKKYLKRWMIYATTVFVWVGGILIRVVPAAFVTTIVQDGVCHRFSVWESPEAKATYGFWSFISFCVFPAMLFVYCYGRIVLVVRRQARVMAAHNAQASAQTNAAQMESERVKWNIIKTMIIVSVALVICWFPVNIAPLAVSGGGEQSLSYMFLYASIFLAYLYICMNPFIYAIKHDGVKQTLAGLMVRCRRAEVTASGVDAS